MSASLIPVNGGQRRSPRIALPIPINVIGQDLEKRAFSEEKLSSVVENRRFLSFTHVEWTGRLSISELPPEVSWGAPGGYSLLVVRDLDGPTLGRFFRLRTALLFHLAHRGDATRGVIFSPAFEAVCGFLDVGGKKFT